MHELISLFPLDGRCRLLSDFYGPVTRAGGPAAATLVVRLPAPCRWLARFVPPSPASAAVRDEP